MDWTPGGVSSDVEDRRDSSGGGGGGFNLGGGGGGIGIIGFIVLLVISLITGHNFLGGLFSGGGSPQSQSQSQPTQSYDAAPATPRAHPAGDDRDVQLISFVLDDAQKTWTGIFDQDGKQYRHAKLVLFRNATYSGCGTAQSATGPFYCPQDEKIYIDLGFWDELARMGGSTADFAQSYVLAHELGHHIQNILGIEAKMRRLQQQQPGERNHLSVDLELQADCFAGVWAHNSEHKSGIHEADIDEGLKAAAAVGDDHIQKMSRGTISPESFTHGSSAQRQMWFRRGLDGGTVASCNTFAEQGSGTNY